MSAIKSVKTAINKLINTFDNDDQKGESALNIKEIETIIPYSNNIGKRFTIKMPSNDDPGKFFTSMNNIKHKVINGRNKGCMFASHGFQLIDQTTSLTKKDFYTNNNEIIEKTYYREMEKAIKKLTGAAAVICMHHQVRCGGEKPDYATVKVDPPAPAAHCDYSGHNAIKSLSYGINLLKTKTKEQYKEDVDYTKGRFCVINAWRNINDTIPIYNDHLAVMDGRTVIAPDDFLKYDFIANGYSGESYYLSAEHESLHKWYYFPRMEKNELLCFMQYDSDHKAPARYGFHTAIKDPTVEKMKNCPPRESIEVRLLAFFPDFEPNTIPVLEEEKLDEASVVKEAVQGTKNGIKVPNMWPQTSYDMMADKLEKEKIEDVVKWMLEGARSMGLYHLTGASDEVIKQCVDEIMKDGEEFKKTALKNFPVKNK